MICYSDKYKKLDQPQSVLVEGADNIVVDPKHGVLHCNFD